MNNNNHARIWIKKQTLHGNQTTKTEIKTIMHNIILCFTHIPYIILSYHTLTYLILYIFFFCTNI